MPTTSTQLRVRALNFEDTKSMRTWALHKKAYPAPSVNTAANTYHWISSQALELVPNTLRTMALPALMRVTIRINHIDNWPMPRLRASMSRLIRSRKDMEVSRRREQNPAV